jgi:ELWxxDGT repeat protein
MKVQIHRHFGRKAQLVALAVLCAAASTNVQAQTRLVKDINTGVGVGSAPSDGFFFKGKLYFTADEGGSAGRQVWVSDGSTAGTSRLCATPCLWVTNNELKNQFKEAGGNLYFLANGREIWKTDGTSTGMALDLGPDAANFKDSNVEGFEGALYFSTCRGASPCTLATIWRTDGTVAGTTQVATMNLGNGPYNRITLQATPRGLYALTFSTIGNLTGGTLSRLVNGTFTQVSGGTRGMSTRVFPIGDFDYFSTRETSSVGVRRTDGTASGTSLLIACNLGWSEAIAGFGDGVFTRCGAADALKFDVATLSSSFFKSVTSQFLPLNANGRLLGADTELWKSDGTAAGTVPLKQINGSGQSIPASLTLSGSEVFFFANDGVRGRELWKTDGTAPGTTLVNDINPGSGNGEPTTAMMTATPLGFFFSANDGQNGDELHLLPTLPLYRLYSDVTKEHLYTTDWWEDYVLGTRGWTREGVGFRVFPKDDLQGGVRPIALHRLYHEGILQHLLTTDGNEASTLPSMGWKYEGVVGYILPSPATGSTPLYRMSLASPPLHLWTTDANEYQTLQSHGWVGEGIIGHVIR